MDRIMIYPGSIPRAVDLLNTNRNTMVALAGLSEDVFGTDTIARGFDCTPSSIAANSVTVGPGRIYCLANIDSTAYSSLAADTTHDVVKQGIVLDDTTLSCPAPTSSGQSITYLVQASYQDVDTDALVLPYYNSSNPAQAYSGPNNTGTANNTTRAGRAVLSVKAGTSAATGSQAVPAPDTGAVGLWAVTVTYGQVAISAENIASYGSQRLTTSILGLIRTPTQGRSVGVQVFTQSATYIRTSGTRLIHVRAIGGGGAGGSTPATTSGNCAVGSGGAAGAYVEAWFLVDSVSSLPVNVGAAGTPSAGTAGGSGGTTTLGSLLSAAGGGGGQVIQQSTSVAAFFAGQGSASSQPTVTGAQADVAAAAGQPGSCGLGFAGTLVSGQGAPSPFGGGGNNTSSGAGTAASAYGAGGSGAATVSAGAAALGGSGGRGLVIVTEYS